MADWYSKFPNEVMFFAHDMGPALAEGDAYVGEPVVTASTPSLTIDQAGWIGDTDEVRMRIAGGPDAGGMFLVYITAATSAGETIVEERRLAVKRWHGPRD